MKTAKVNTYFMHIFGQNKLYPYRQPKISLKRITFMTSKRQIHTYIPDTGNKVEI